MPYRALVYALVASIFGGCAGVQPVLDTAAAPDPTSGYVAGLFTRMKTRGFAFIVRATDGGAEFIMPLGEDSSLPKEVTDQTIAIRVPAGTYAVTEWITYATLTKEITTRKAVSGVPLNRPFVVTRGSVTHLGAYDVSHSTQVAYPVTTTHLRVQPRRVSEARVREAFAATYPNLGSLEVRCVLCAGATGPASPQ
jgi:hypothetical protein